MMENGQGHASINIKMVNVNKTILLYVGNDEERRAKNRMGMIDLNEIDWMA